MMKVAASTLGSASRLAWSRTGDRIVPGGTHRIEDDRVEDRREAGLDDMLVQSSPASDPPSSTSGIARVEPPGHGSGSSPDQVA
jgi:hypothetical protein